MTKGEATSDRTLLTLTGKDALSFLQALVSNDVRPLQAGPGLVWTALLTPQGKYLADFFVVRRPDGDLLLDIATAIAPATQQRLNMYRLRADVQIAPSPLHVRRGLGPAPEGALADPRHTALGWRDYCDTPGSAPTIDWNAIRVEHVIPESGVELVPGESYILEHGFEPLHGVDFRKGCYVGQEVTARMKHKTALRKGLVKVTITGLAPPGTEITTDGKSVGTLFTQAAGQALAYLRFDQADGEMQAEGAMIRRGDQVQARRPG